MVVLNLNNTGLFVGNYYEGIMLLHDRSNVCRYRSVIRNWYIGFTDIR